MSLKMLNQTQDFMKIKEIIYKDHKLLNIIIIFKRHGSFWLVFYFYSRIHLHSDFFTIDLVQKLLANDSLEPPISYATMY